MWGYGNLKKAISIFESKRLGKIQRLFLRMERKNGIFQDHQIPKKFLMKRIQKY
jgi:hypothetical protein